MRAPIIIFFFFRFVSRTRVAVHSSNRYNNGLFASCTCKLSLCVHITTRQRPWIKIDGVERRQRRCSGWTTYTLSLVILYIYDSVTHNAERGGSMRDVCVYKCVCVCMCVYGCVCHFSVSCFGMCMSLIFELWARAEKFANPYFIFEWLNNKHTCSRARTPQNTCVQRSKYILFGHCQYWYNILRGKRTTHTR